MSTAKLSIIGVGYVGLCSAIGFGLAGHEVVAVGRTQSKINMINSGKSPIFEEGVDEALSRIISGKKFRATTDLAGAIRDTDITFVCVGTPSGPDGGIDLDDIRKCSGDIGTALKSKSGYHVIVVKSTVVPGTTEDVVIRSIEQASGKKAGKDFGVAMNPEFLREGKALEDFMKPDRIVVGEFDKRSGDAMEALYASFESPVLRVPLKTAEMIKYASNAFLATKISFINEIGNMCKKMGIDVYDIARGMGYDKRIGHHFLNASGGFGGSCFPKDVGALISKAKKSGADVRILETIMDVNEEQKAKIVAMLKAKTDIKGKKIAVLGLAFKDGTDDIREAPSVVAIKELIESGSKVFAYDPKAEANMKNVFPNIVYCSSAREALKDADACLILTEWPEFKDLSDKDFASMRGKIIIEGRKMLDKGRVSNFEGVCW